MIRGSKFAVGLALGVAMLTTASVTPAFAAKKEKPAAAPKLNFSDKFKAGAGPIEALLKAQKFVEAIPGLQALEAISISPDEKYYVNRIRLDVAIKTKDVALQNAALDGMIASGGSPASELGKFNFFSGTEAYNAKNYPKAIQRLGEADRLGYKSLDSLPILMAQSHFQLKQYAEGLPLAERAVAQEIAAGKAAPADWYRRARAAAYQGKQSAAVSKWSRMLIKAYPTVENWRDGLSVYRDLAKLDRQPALDLLRLMRSTKALSGERDYYEYAGIAADSGLPSETKIIVDEGRALGALTAAAKNVNEIYAIAAPKAAADRAAIIASLPRAAADPTGKSSARIANGFLGLDDNAKAAELYQAALTKGGLTGDTANDIDTVNLRLGIALARSGQKDAARAAFAKVTGLRAEMAAFWLLWLDTSV